MSEMDSSQRATVWLLCKNVTVGETLHNKIDGSIIFKSGVGKPKPTLNMQKRNIMDLAGGTLVISSCWWITGGWNEENELWSINLSVHHYPPSHAPAVCLSVSACFTVCLLHGVGLHIALRIQKLSDAPWTHPFLPSPLGVLRAGQSSTLMISPILGFREVLARQVRGGRGRGGSRGQQGW